MEMVVFLVSNNAVIVYPSLPLSGDKLTDSVLFVGAVSVVSGTLPYSVRVVVELKIQILFTLVGSASVILLFERAKVVYPYVLMVFKLGVVDFMG